MLSHDYEARDVKVFYGFLGLESVSLEENERRYYNKPPIE